MKKSRSKISQSSREVRDQIIAMFDNGATLKEVALKFGELTGEKISHKAAESFYHGDYKQYAEKIHAAKAYAQQLNVAAGEGTEIQKGIGAALTQKAFEIMTRPGAELDDIHSLGTLFLNLQRTENDNQRVSLEKQRQTTREKSLEVIKSRAALELRKYQDKVAEAKAMITATLDKQKKRGGITPETLKQLETSLNML